MAHQHQLRQRLERGDIVWGVCNMYPSAGIIESLCPGWDFVWIDGQHGQLAYDALVGAVRAAEALGVDTLIRSSGSEYGLLGPIADMDPAAVMVPMINTAEQAQSIIDALRFPPLGRRSYGGRRVIDRHGRNYYKEVVPLVIAQIETMEAVRNVDQIVGTDGVDMVFFGPDDMRVQMGIPVNTPVAESPQLLDAMKRTAKAARDAGKFAGTVAPTPELARMNLDAGYTLLVGGSDVGFIKQNSTKAQADLRSATGSPAPAAAPAARPVGTGIYAG